MQGREVVLGDVYNASLPQGKRSENYFSDRMSAYETALGGDKVLGQPDTFATLVDSYITQSLEAEGWEWGDSQLQTEIRAEFKKINSALTSSPSRAKLMLMLRWFMTQQGEALGSDKETSKLSLQSTNANVTRLRDFLVPLTQLSEDMFASLSSPYDLRAFYALLANQKITKGVLTDDGTGQNQFYKYGDSLKETKKTFQYIKSFQQLLADPTQYHTMKSQGWWSGFAQWSEIQWDSWTKEAQRVPAEAQVQYLMGSRLMPVLRTGDKAAIQAALQKTANEVYEKHMAPSAEIRGNTKTLYTPVISE
jgi:hypothetical protein